jgi:hypothetical protein
MFISVRANLQNANKRAASMLSVISGDKGASMKKPMGEAAGADRLITLGIALAMIAGFMWFVHWLMHTKEILPPSLLV